MCLYSGPFEWMTSYNLGLVHLATGQYASAFHFLSSSINIKPDHGPSYMYLAVALAWLDDYENSCRAYERAISLNSDYMCHLNYGTALVWDIMVSKHALFELLQCTSTRAFPISWNTTATDSDLVLPKTVPTSSCVINQGRGL